MHFLTEDQEVRPVLRMLMALCLSSTRRGHSLTIQELVYVSGHTVVLHNLAENTQRLLRGHRHQITCTAARFQNVYLRVYPAATRLCTMLKF